MITSKKTDGTYGEIGFIKAKQEDGSYKDIECQYDNKGNLIFEKGFTRSKEGVLPLVINGIGKPLKDYTIEGNILQATTPTADNPQEVKGCGNKIEFNRTNITIIGVESSTNYAYFDISAMPNAKVNDVVNILVANTEYQLRVKKISGSYIYVENKVV